MIKPSIHSSLGNEVKEQFNITYADNLFKVMAVLVFAGQTLVVAENVFKVTFRFPNNRQPSLG